jgi:Fatty acid desaturase
MLISNFVFWSAVGMLFFFIVFPNHDTVEVLKTHSQPKWEPIVDASGKVVGQHVTKQMDWGEMQVVNSCNFRTDGSLGAIITAMVVGGMNHQIEHHLFPTMSHEHTWKVAPIVQQTCKEFGIPYNSKKSWVDAAISHYKLLKLLRNKKLDAAQKLE